jgi:hypothetical protein
MITGLCEMVESTCVCTGFSFLVVDQRGGPAVVRNVDSTTSWVTTPQRKGLLLAPQAHDERPYTKLKKNKSTVR